MPFENAKVEILCEVDEQWSFVGSKKQQRWLFYVWESRFKKVIAHAFGSRTIHMLMLLLERMSPYNFSIYCTDNWKPYASILPEKKHVIGKLFTQSVERENLNLRT